MKSHNASGDKYWILADFLQSRQTCEGEDSSQTWVQSLWAYWSLEILFKLQYFSDHFGVEVFGSYASCLLWNFPLWSDLSLSGLAAALSSCFFCVCFFMTYFHIIFCLYRMFHRISSESNIFMYVCFKKCVRRFPVWGVLCSLCVLVSFKGRRLTGNKEQTPVLLLVIQTVKPKARGQRRKLWPWESFTVLPRFMLQRGLLFKGTCLSVCLLVFPTYIWAHILLTFELA